jgi:hypothetical protein
LNTKLKLPSASIKPDNQGEKYEGMVFCSAKIFSRAFLFIYLLFLFAIKLAKSFSSMQFLAKSS